MECGKTSDEFWFAHAVPKTCCQKSCILIIVYYPNAMLVVKNWLAQSKPVNQFAIVHLSAFFGLEIHPFLMDENLGIPLGFSARSPSPPRLRPKPGRRAKCPEVLTPSTNPWHENEILSGIGHLAQYFYSHLIGEKWWWTPGMILSLDTPRCYYNWLVDSRITQVNHP